MNLMHIFTDIPILIVLFTFLFSIIYCMKNYFFANRNLNILLAFISGFKKTDLDLKKLMNGRL